jgi:agmatine/peptidylarginine deiminase
MSTESIIGLVASIIGIVAGLWTIREIILWAKKKFSKRPMITLFNQLLDKNTSDKKCKEILKKLNSYPEISNRIKEDYIKNFDIENYGYSKEKLLFDLCDSNDITPTRKVCEGLVGSNMPSFLTKYEAKRKSSIEEPAAAPVEPTIKNETKEQPAKQTREQIVYMSELLKTRYPDTCARLTQILEKYHVNYKFLKATKDIWCRDYMPVQTESGKLIQFKYDPSYLKDNKEWEESRSDVKEVCKVNGIEAQYSDINLDGGNVLICDGRAILSNRIFSENPNMGKEELVNELSRLLECEIIIIPAENDDMTGHADGMVRFINKNTILGNTMAEEYKYWQDGMQKVIDKYNLKYIDVPFFVPKDPKHPYSAVGIYVNYLEVNNLIVMPVFGREEDQKAFDVIQKVFPDKVIEKIDYNDVALEGGLLNCTTWVIIA